MGKLSSCMQFIKSRILYHKWESISVPTVQVTLTASDHAMNTYLMKHFRAVSDSENLASLQVLQDFVSTKHQLMDRVDLSLALSIDVWGMKHPGCGN